MCFGAGGAGGDRPLATPPIIPGGSQDPASPGLPSLAPPPPGNNQSPLMKLFSPFGLVGGAGGLKHLSPLAGIVNLFK